LTAFIVECISVRYSRKARNSAHEVDALRMMVAAAGGSDAETT